MTEPEYNQIVDRYLDTVYRIALTAALNPQDAEDITQNTFFKLLAKPPQFHDEDHLRKWLIRVSINEGKSIWRSGWRKRVCSLEEMPYEPEFSRWEYTELYNAVAELPVKYRLVVQLYYFDDYSVKEISEILKVSETAIRNRLMRARGKLKEQLKETWL